MVLSPDQCLLSPEAEGGRFGESVDVKCIGREKLCRGYTATSREMRLLLTKLSRREDGGYARDSRGGIL